MAAAASADSGMKYIFLCLNTEIDKIYYSLCQLC